MGENKYQKLLFIILFRPLGSVGVLLFALGIIGISIYFLNSSYNPGLFFDWRPWLNPLLLASFGFLFIYLSLKGIKKDAHKFLKDIEIEKDKMVKKLKSIEKGNINDKFIPDSSEFGINDLDIEMITLIKENGGYIPLLKRDIDDSSISYTQAIKSLAKLELMGYVKIFEEEYSGRSREKLILTVKGLEILETPRIAFSTIIPEDITLMLIHAHTLYRRGEFETTIGKCYNTLERALKTHLIPSIDDYIEKWNKKHPDRRWKGNKTMVSLNALFNFYRENVEMDKNIAKFVKNTIDYIAEVRSRYSHDKPSEKYKNDAYRVLKLTELILGMMFENLKEQVGMKSVKIASIGNI